MAAAVAAGTPTPQGDITGAEPNVKLEKVERPDVKKPEDKAEPAKPKPEPKTPEQVRQANIEKHARKMNAEAEKDGIELDAPEKERRQKPGPKPGAKRAPKPAEAQTAPAKPAPQAARDPGDNAERADDTDPSQDADDADDGGKPEPRAALQLKAKTRLRHGDVDKAIRLAFGDLKSEEFDAVRSELTKKLEPNSKKWVEVRKFRADAERDLSAKQQKLIDGAKALESEYRPLVEARKAMKAGKRAEAFKLAFGEDINDFQRAALREELSADAGTARLQNEVATLRRELEEVRSGKRSEPSAEQSEAEQATAVKRGKDKLYEQLRQSEDGEVRAFGRKAAFIDRVWDIRLQHFDPATRTTIPLQLAAEIARDETRAMLRSWSDENESSGSSAPDAESPALAGNEPVRTSQRARSPNPSQAAGGGIATRSMSREERISAYARAMGG